MTNFNSIDWPDDACVFTRNLKTHLDDQDEVVGDIYPGVHIPIGSIVREAETLLSRIIVGVSCTVSGDDWRFTRRSSALAREGLCDVNEDEAAAAAHLLVGISRVHESHGCCT